MKLPNKGVLYRLRRKGMTLHDIGHYYGCTRQAVHAKLSYRYKRGPHKKGYPSMGPPENAASRPRFGSRFLAIIKQILFWG